MKKEKTTNRLKTTIKIEEFSMLILSIYALFQFSSPWWYFVLMLIGPDISMVGYLAGNIFGALVYNFFHHRAVAILVFLTGLTIGQTELQAAGVILFGHSAMDRMLGFGLKYNQGFKFTHLN
ncbi:DUF4260 domain-containing protein [Dyadobacter sp. LJ53]|uniref:DUF4260 domain-containing protein n=1 Tax=Dyadobacter chenwenxiniae TaxID=2906456 RepID=UPI001F1FBF32|nr:DUF4260 domain-containing protein [Dyadobacter chenwenxiniae]MCF0051692.1 DUF4260 domain-containing protein [Dyadobacter chenwenxiniae]